MAKSLTNKKTHIFKILLPFAVLLILAAAAFYFLFIKTQEISFSRLKKGKDLNYILITVDTLRADRIGCYGFSSIETPTMDLFASLGVLFEKCISQTPLTLPSHASLLTGTHPLFHGVRDNGGFLLPQEIVTLAEVFKQQGYQTSAFVSSYVLDSKWGTDQGFDHYFDQFDLSKYRSISLGNVQRRGDEVIDEALAWLDQQKNGRFFSWVHLYDPHTPYEPPSPYKEMYPNRPYAGEVAYTDSQLSRLWDFIERNDLVDNTVVIFTSDHGESLGEHQESAHGFFIYQEGVHVPLIIVTPFKELQGLRRKNLVSLVDVMPTLLEMDGIPIPAQVQGESLLPLLFNEDSGFENPAYCETYYPRFHYGWSELKSIQDGRYKLIIAPELELYDLTLDPDELQNLVDSHPAEARRLLNLSEYFMAEGSQGGFEQDYHNIDEESREKLAALGYIGSFSEQTSLEGKRLGNPREKIGIFNRLSQSREWMLEGKYTEALSLIQEIIEEDPEVVDAYFTLGNLYFRQNDFNMALDSFTQVLERRPNDAFVVINIANSYLAMGEFDEAERFLELKIDSISSDSQLYYVLGNLKFLKDEYGEAIGCFEKCLELNPSSAAALNALGGVYVKQGSLNEAEAYLLKALGANPDLRNLHYNLALLHEERQEMTKAAGEYQQELEKNPYNFRASFNLARVHRLMKNLKEEETFLEKAIEINPNFPMSYFYLARIYLNRGEKYNTAISLVEKGIECKPPEKDLPLGYFLLADLYNRTGQFAKSEEYVQKGRALVQKR